MQPKIKESIRKLSEWYDRKQVERSVPNPLKIVKGGSGDYIRIVKWRERNQELVRLLEEEGIIWDSCFCENATLHKEFEKEDQHNHITLTMLNYLILSDSESKPIVVQYTGSMDRFSDGTKMITTPRVKVLNKRDAHRVMKKVFR